MKAGDTVSVILDEPVPEYPAEDLPVTVQAKESMTVLLLLKNQSVQEPAKS